ncbi:MAG: tryptophan synthase subunit alpha [Gammaproteobacteria bacterium]|nr:MAG: tryptophan synthase subunit alpha [Gammaproteobacteria bacterium]
MSRIEGRLSELRNAGRKALVTFITAGDPNVDASVPALHALVRGGADILELGMPFSDPEAEGPSIQRSSERALAGGITLRRMFDMVAAFRTEDAATPVVLMGYLNALERTGYPEFVEQAHGAGVDGLIIVNLPPEEAQPLKQLTDRCDMNLIFMVAPTTTEERMQLIVEQAGGFVYYVSLKGVTGANHLRPDSIPDQVAALRRHTNHPIMIGFGIKDAAAARSVSRYGDGVVVGSVLVDTMADLADDPTAIPVALQNQIAEFRAALDSD